MKTVTCSYCGKQWQDDHPDLPGSVIWCGDCNRNGVTGVANRITVKENTLRCISQNEMGYAIAGWLPAGEYYRDGYEIIVHKHLKHSEQRVVVSLISAVPGVEKKYFVYPESLLKVAGAT